MTGYYGRKGLRRLVVGASARGPSGGTEGCAQRR